MPAFELLMKILADLPKSNNIKCARPQYGIPTDHKTSHFTILHEISGANIKGKDFNAQSAIKIP